MQSVVASEPPAHKLLDRLDGVKHTGEGRWLACCPGHGDRTPSLSIRETGDGTLLVHCFAGCRAADVVAAIGLSLSDLFPERPEDRAPLRRGERWMPRDVLACVAREALIVEVAAQTMKRGEALNDTDIQRLGTAEQRLRAAAREVGCDV